jgi:hypothetical protein
MENYQEYLIPAGVLVFLLILFVRGMRHRPEKHDDKTEQDLSVELTGKLAQMSERLEQNFESITNKSLNQNAEFVQKMSTNGVELLLRPLIDQLKEYEGKMERMVKDESKERASMMGMIKCVNV